MKKIKLASNIMIVSLVFFLLYNSYFGWNDNPINKIEEICDGVFHLFFNLSLIIYFSPILSLYEKYVKENLKE